MKKALLITITIIALPLIAIATETAEPPEKKTLARPNIEVVFVLDTTGSMSGLINAAKQKIWSIANTMTMTEPAPQIKMGLVGYRDRGDAYVTKHLALTEDLDKVYEFLMGFQAGGGGDGPESVNQALNEAVEKMQWSTDEKSYKVIYLVGDFPPHMDYKDDVKYTKSCKAAATKGITINTIQCGWNVQTTSVWKEIAKLAEGEFFSVGQSGGAVVVDTPYDAELAELSRELDKTRIYYGSQSEQKQQLTREKLADKLYKKASTSAIAARAKFNSSKAGARNLFGEQELVMDVSSGKVELDEINEDQLNEKMQKMTPKQREEYVVKMAAERKTIQKQIEELSTKRQLYIKKQIDEKNINTADSLDQKIYQCIQTQAGKKDIVYKDGPMY